jgi:hypothetical protein
LRNLIIFLRFFIFVFFVFFVRFVSSLKGRERVLSLAGTLRIVYTTPMIDKVNAVVFPEGDTQEIDGPLSINQMVDLNGRPLVPPLPTHRMIAFRVVKISTRQTRNEEIREHYLEIIPANELREFTV